MYENDEIEVALKSCSLKSTVEAANTSTESLTDGGYEESSSSYCLYARRRYKQGEQVEFFLLFYLPDKFLLLKVNISSIIIIH